MRIKLLPKFIISLVVVGLILTALISLCSFIVTVSNLFDMAEIRVMTNTKAIAAMLDVEDVKKIIAPGGDQTPEYKEMYELFNKLKKDGDVTFLSLVIPKEDRVCFFIDAMVEEMGDDPAAQIPYGTEILYVDAADPTNPHDMENYITIWEHYKNDKGVDKPLVTNNSYGFNFTGVEVILDENGKAVAELEYIIDMTEILEYLLDAFLSTILVSFVVITIIVLIYIVTVRKTIIKPVRKLTAFAEGITESKVFEKQRIEIKTGDEIESLGNSFNYMLIELENYIDNLSKATAEKERIGAELDVARHIQSSMLPCIFPAFPDRKEFDIYATMTPAKEVGGDFYDFFMVDERHLAIVMADVSGKGIPAALFMVIGKTLIKDHTTPGYDMGDVFSIVNNLLCESNSEGLFITAFAGVLDLATGQFDFVNAGHELPFICKADGSYEAYKIRPGFVLAGMEDIKYRAGTILLEEGDKLFQYTDGVTEATDINNTLYGMDRLKAVLNRNKDENPHNLLPAIKKDIDEFVGEAPQFDDITMLCLEYRKKMVIEEEKEVKEITLAATIDNIPAVTEFVDTLLEELDCPIKAQIQIDIAIDELFSNIANYAYAPASGDATVRVEVLRDPKTVLISFIDRGLPYNPLTKEDPDVSLSAEERKIGGLGVFVVKKSMDDVTYEYRDGQNILTIKKILS